jgi:pimeloyl-ACP methyl ester carboxylesterase
MALAGGTAAAAAGGLAAQRRFAARRAERAGPAELGTLRSDPHVVVADDGLLLHVEIDEVDPEVAADAPTVVLVHGYVLDLGCWHFQRAALRGRYRVVLYDQRSHGRSGRSDPARTTIEQLGRDLATVLHEVTTGPVVLIGHSMGGMSMLALAEQFPEVVAERIVGVAFMATSAGGVGQLLPGAPGRLLDRAQPLVVAGLARLPWLVETGRRTTAFALTKRIAFGGEVPDSYVVFVDQMISRTPSDVIWDFFPELPHPPPRARLGRVRRRAGPGGGGRARPRAAVQPHGADRARAAPRPSAGDGGRRPHADARTARGCRRGDRGAAGRGRRRVGRTTARAGKAAMSRQEWDRLAVAMSACIACDLSQSRQRVVPGQYPPGAQVLLVGEAPGREEDEGGEPFVGRSGRLLDGLLADVGLDRARMAVVNTVKVPATGQPDAEAG